MYLWRKGNKWRKMTGLGFDLCNIESESVCGRFKKINKEIRL